MSARLALLAGLSLGATLLSPAATAADPPKVLQDLFNRATQAAKERKPNPPVTPEAAPPTPAAPALPGPAAPTASSAGAAPAITAAVTAASAKADARYSPSADGQEVTDTRTGLVWRRCAEGMAWTGSTCSGTPTVFRSAVQALKQARGGWRVPTHDELKGLARLSAVFDPNVGILGIDGSTFPGTPAQSFWSSTLYYKDRGDRDRTRVVYFNGVATSADGFRDNGEEALLRLVRDAGSSGAAAAAASEPPAVRPAAASGPRFSVSANGQEVTDQHSGLTWRRCAEGMSLRGNSCTGTALAVDHAGALARAVAQARAGGQAWRLPEVDELRSLATDTRPGPTIDGSLFPGTPAAPFWTTFQENPTTFKAVNFYNGDTDSRYHTSPHHLRLVRGGAPAAAPAFR